MFSRIKYEGAINQKETGTSSIRKRQKRQGHGSKKEATAASCGDNGGTSAQRSSSRGDSVRQEEVRPEQDGHRRISKEYKLSYLLDGVEVSLSELGSFGHG